MNKAVERWTRYPWQRELDEWNVGRQDEIRKQVLEMKTVAEMNTPPAPVDSVIKCAKAMQSHPEVWEVILRMVKVIEKHPDEDVIEELNDDIAFIGQFRDWYLMKNKIEYDRNSYVMAHGLIFEMVRGNIDEIDSPEAVELLLRSPFIVK